ncbi:hypothetical protein [Cryptosporidium parvum Iowa II]|uniref:Uncharacterized protein n=3 Tax=Cryptosporidium parvum TaxID=5807 RepID=Q5CXE8_CRYPI|nr:hypothetical protein [Cryptosporidium parvum Iowa II]EAK89814.1 hypothetical protein cgd6_1350 [Cryptosporidium parvum Iowa II]WKS78242.1 putative transmembrane domain-containing protein [Cryptosporidium sp. 43IA8]WRK32732.1 Uncharacterized protein cpbgf_6001350 [Cryptosporidium parvum]
MSEYNGIGGKLARPVIECLKSLKNYIRDYDPLENDCRYDIFQELLTFRKSWRKLSTSLEEIDNNINQDLVREFYENNICIDECRAREDFINIISKNFENNTHPAFEMYYHNNVDENEDLNYSVVSSNESFETFIKILEFDFEERQKKIAELESIKQEHLELVAESKSMDLEQEELNKYIEPFKKSLELITSYLDDSNCEENEGFCPNTLLELHKNLRPIYIYFNSFKDRINSNNDHDQVVHVNVDEYGQVVIGINRPLSKIEFDTVSTNFQDFLINIFPIKLEFSTMNTLSSREVVLLSVFMNTNKQLKCHIFSDILFDKDTGENIPLIDEETLEVLQEEISGKPYYWLQYFVNNVSVIPIKLNEMNLDPGDLFKMIECRIQNFIFFNFLLYLASIGPQLFISFILFYSEIESIDTQAIEINFDSFSFNTVNEISKHSILIKTENKDIYVEIELSGNMSYCIKFDELIYKEEFRFIENELNIDKNLVYNKEITMNFCKNLSQALLNIKPN